MRIFIAGCGDIGCRIASKAVSRGIEVAALSRSEKRMELIKGVKAVTGSLDDPENLPSLPVKDSAVIYLVPPPGGGIQDTRVTAFLGSLKPGEEPSKIIYISTTSVYGDCGEQLVDESFPLNPGNHTARRRVDAEQQMQKWCMEHEVSLAILRVSGIYSIDRIPMHRIYSREPLLDEAFSGFTNRIHADDLANICLAAVERAEDGDIFNVSDGEIGRMNDYFNAITDAIGVERLPVVGPDEARQLMTPLMYGYMTESRKINSEKMIRKLGIKLEFPSLKDGLKGLKRAVSAA